MSSFLYRWYEEDCKKKRYGALFAVGNIMNKFKELDKIGFNFIAVQGRGKPTGKLSLVEDEQGRGVEQIVLPGKCRIGGHQELECFDAAHIFRCEVVEHLCVLIRLRGKKADDHISCRLQDVLLKSAFRYDSSRAGIKWQSASAADRAAVEPIFADAVFGAAEKALDDKVVEGRPAAAADRIGIQPGRFNAVLLPAAKAPDNQTALFHLDVNPVLSNVAKFIHDFS